MGGGRDGSTVRCYLLSPLSCPSLPPFFLLSYLFIAWCWWRVWSITAILFVPVCDSELSWPVQCRYTLWRTEIVKLYAVFYMDVLALCGELPSYALWYGCKYR